MVAPKQSPAKTNVASKMHRRSRSGCYTCRLRRKKCDEGQNCCKACRNLGLQCEYKRPLWWNDNNLRKKQKELIKSVIKRTKVSEKAAHGSMGADTPPGLSYSLPTSATYSGNPHTRAPSVDSPYSPGYDFSQQPIHDQFDMYNNVLSPPYDANSHYQNFISPPYEVDIKTVSQMYVNDVPTRKDSSTSSFSTYHPPPVTAGMTPFPEEHAWVHDEIYGNENIFGAEETLDFDFGYDTPHVSQSVRIDVADCDRPLLDHFIENVLRLIFPVHEVNQHGSVRSDIILRALESNKAYLHCALSISASHLKSTQRVQNEQLEVDIMRHRGASITEICEACKRNTDTDHEQILEASLGMMFFQCTVGRPGDDLADIPWHQHFQAASDCVKRLHLQNDIEPVTGEIPRPPFNMTLTSWIDILGATMLGRCPQFAATYRERNEGNLTSGLSELMGCEDKVMYIISEIACLDSLILTGQLDHFQICSLVASLGKYLDTIEESESGRADFEHASTQTGAIRPRQLSKNITAMYLLAARIYVMSLIPDSSRNSDSVQDLVARLTGVLEFIPAGPDGFDRSLVWPLLISGSMSTPNSPFRYAFADRIASLGEHAEFGSFGRMVRLVQEVWQQADNAGGRQDVHWRDVMLQKGWDYLLI
ncbi:MAG: hypothetical protein Q9161_005731 [Pseudevernia consocians]